MIGSIDVLMRRAYLQVMKNTQLVVKALTFLNRMNVDW